MNLRAVGVAKWYTNGFSSWALSNVDVLCRYSIQEAR